MPVLSTAVKDAIAVRIESALSLRRDQIPVGAAAIRSGINLFDTELDAAETAILAAVPAAVQTWLTANQSISREILIAVAMQRKETL